MKKIVKYVGLDVHKDSITIAIADEGRDGNVRLYGKIRNNWGDPLHEFVKLEWFTWPVSKDFAKGQVKGYFGEHVIGEDDCLKISIYTAMSIFSTVVWTLRFYPKTMGNIEQKITSILKHYRFFEKTIPDWAI